MSPSNNLLLLMADLDAENAMLGILTRHQALGTTPLRQGQDFQIYRHPERDPGCCSRGVEYLRAFSGQFKHAILVFDLHGSGRDRERPDEIENDLEDRLSSNGWPDGRAKVIVIDRELEAWAWTQSPHLERLIRWSSPPNLSEWLVQKKWITATNTKPQFPKEALHAANGSQPRAAFFKELAENVSFRNCQDRSFNRLLTALRTWFPADAQEDHQ